MPEASETPTFDRDTAVHRHGPDVFEAAISERWFVLRGPNGGYVAAILLRALSVHLDDPLRPVRSLSIHYPRAPAAGPVRIECTLERSGGSVSTLSARMTQEGKLVALALAAFSSPWAGMEFAEAEMPEAASPETLPPLPARDNLPPFAGNFEYRPALGEEPFSGADRAYVGGWIRPIEPRLVDPPLVAALADSWPPAPFARATAPFIAPTIDLTIHFRTPSPVAGTRPEDFHLAAFTSRFASDGFFEEDGELWSPDGQLVAQSRQLALGLGS